MQIIEKIEITNFRSITNSVREINSNHLNIIVGQNDIGKSNFLKALNLFFNNDTDFGNSFRFEDDYSKFAKKRKNKADEIKIKITLNTPNRFSNSENLVWMKVWRKNGFHNEKITTISGKEPSKRGGPLQWAKKIKFKYVPAVRGNEYFNYLMGELHDALSEISPTSFNTASNQFIDVTCAVNPRRFKKGNLFHAACKL